MFNECSFVLSKHVCQRPLVMRCVSVFQTPWGGAGVLLQHRGLCRPWPCISCWAGKRGTCCHERWIHIIGADLALSLPQKSKERGSEACSTECSTVLFLATLIPRCRRAKCLTSSLGTGPRCTTFCSTPSMNLGKCFSHHLKALCAYFILVVTKLLGDMCLSVQLYCKWLRRPGTLNWNCPHNFLNFSHNFHDSKHFLFNYESQIYMSILAVFHES